MSTFRKILIVLLFLVLVGGAAYAIYYVFFRPAGTPITTPTNTNVNAGTGGLSTSGGANANIPVVPPLSGTGNLPPASPIAKGGPTLSTLLVNDPTMGAVLSSDGKTLRYYDRATGKFMIVDANGNVVALSDQAFPDVQNVTWSDDGSKVVMEFPDGSKITYDFTAKKQATLPSTWSSFSFSPASDQLAALQLSDSTSSRYLVVAKTDGTGIQPIEPLGDNADKVTVAWSPGGDVVALSQTGEAGDGFGVKNVLFIGKNGENFPSTEINGLSFTPLWSPDGAYLLYSVAGSDDNFKPRLYTVTGSGDNRGSGRRAISLFTTADRCTFFSTTVAYCAVPDTMPDGAGMQPEVLAGIPDAVYRVNVVTGAVTLVGRPDTDTEIASITVAKDGSTLYFTDAATGNIKKMMLK